MSEPSRGAPPWTALPVVGGDLRVPTVHGTTVPYANLDYAASAPCLESVRDTIHELLPWYSSVHRGAGFPSSVCTDLLAAARETIRHFLGGRPDDAVVFTRNTTDSLNLLAAALPRDTTVVTFASEHHANLLPWRRHDVVQLPFPATPEHAVAAADAALRAARGSHRLLAVTGASNVTGEVWPVAALVEAARRHDARVVLDAAQLAPHRAVDLTAVDVDYVALSGHKLYAPFGAGVLVGRSDWLDRAEPYLAGGGAVRRVTLEDAEWATGASRHEAGTPNLVGVVALAAACDTLDAVGIDAVEARERVLVGELVDGLAAVPGLELLSLWGPGHERIGVAAFTLDGWHHGHLAAVLSAEYGIGVRDGAFCAHPLVGSLLERTPRHSGGAVRASFGVGTTRDEIERLVTSLHAVARHGARWSYAVIDGRHVPDPDPRPRPTLLGRFVMTDSPGAAGTAPTERSCAGVVAGS
jgi:selenocysteine lyase/cysteine desulfurase